MPPSSVRPRLLRLAVPLLGLAGCAVTAPGSGPTASAIPAVAPAPPPSVAAVSAILGQRVDAMLAARTRFAEAIAPRQGP